MVLPIQQLKPLLAGQLRNVTVLFDLAFHTSISLYHSQTRYFLFSSRRRHTRYWRDWSSDVCSSDLTNISSAVRTGAMAFLRREFKIVIPVAIVLAVIIGFASSFSNGVAFAVGAALSGIAGLISLRITVNAASRAAHATSKGLGPAFATAFRGGATVGLSVPAMALIAITALYFVYPDPLMIAGDRKSTRLNSSHANISYAVFCLNKDDDDRYGYIC